MFFFVFFVIGLIGGIVNRFKCKSLRRFLYLSEKYFVSNCSMDINNIEIIIILFSLGFYCLFEKGVLVVDLIIGFIMVVVLFFIVFLNVFIILVVIKRKYF